MVKFSPPKLPYVEARYKGGKQTPTLVVLHSTVTTSVRGAALGIANMWNRSTSPKTSAHYVVDEATAYQCVGDHTIAYHCGYNTGSIGMEMCDDPRDDRGTKRWDDKPHQGVMKNTADIVADLCLAYKIPARYLTDEELAAWGRNKTARNGGITTHAQMSRVFKKSSHWDPGEFQFINFLNLVKKFMMEKKAAKEGRPVSKLRVIGWNFWNEQPVQSVRKGLKTMIDENDPEIIVGSEASHMYGHLDGLGRTIVQLKPRRLRSNSVSNNGNTMIAVRKDVPILKRNKIRMKIFFRGPKVGRLQDPRVDRVVKILIDDKKVKIRSGHGPFGKAAKDEYVVSHRKFLKKAKIPTIIVEDANMGQKELRDRVANPAGAKVAGKGIDVVQYKNCVLVDKKDLGKFNSDHPAMRYDFTF